MLVLIEKKKRQESEYIVFLVVDHVWDVVSWKNASLWSNFSLASLNGLEEKME